VLALQRQRLLGARRPRSCNNPFTPTVHSSRVTFVIFLSYLCSLPTTYAEVKADKKCIDSLWGSAHAIYELPSAYSL